MKTTRVKYVKIACLAAVLSLLACPWLWAKITPAPNDMDLFWVNAGGGFCSVNGGLGYDPGGISGGISVSYLTKGNLFSFRGIENSEFKLDLWGYTGPPEKVWDVGILYGRIAKAPLGFASISAGIGLVGGSEYGESTSLHAGIPLESQLFWTPGATIGFGLYGFANLNSRKSFAGALVCLQFGILR